MLSRSGEYIHRRAGLVVQLAIQDSGAYAASDRAHSVHG
jgi:hypothetical protein